MAHAYQEFIAPGTYSFRSRGDVVALRDVVKFHGEMVDSDGAVQAAGLEFLVLGPDGGSAPTTSSSSAELRAGT